MEKCELNSSLKEESGKYFYLSLLEIFKWYEWCWDVISRNSHL